MPVVESRVSCTSLRSPSLAQNPRGAERMQPTAQAVGTTVTKILLWLDRLLKSKFFTPQSPSLAKYTHNQTPPHAAGRISPRPRHAPPDSDSSSRSKYCDRCALPASLRHTSPAPNT